MQEGNKSSDWTQKKDPVRNCAWIPEKVQFWRSTNKCYLANYSYQYLGKFLRDLNQWVYYQQIIQCQVICFDQYSNKLANTESKYHVNAQISRIRYKNRKGFFCSGESSSLFKRVSWNETRLKKEEKKVGGGGRGWGKAEMGRKGRRENEEEGEERKESSSKRNPLPRVEAILIQTYERGKSNMMLLRRPWFGVNDDDDMTRGQWGQR